MGTKIPVAGVEERKFHGINNAAHCIDDTACQKPHEACPGHGAQYFGYSQYAHPSHGNVNQGRKPFRACNPQSVDKDTHNGNAPHQGQHGPAGFIAQDNHAYRRIGACYQNKNHHMVYLAQQLINLRGDIQGMVYRAGRIKANHAQNENCQCADMHMSGVMSCL